MVRSASVRTSLLFLVLCACGSSSGTAGGSTTTRSTEPMSSGTEPTGTLEVDGLLFAACALEVCPADVRSAFATLERSLTTLAAAPRRPPPLDVATRERWSEVALEPYMDGVRPELEASFARLYEGIEDDPGRALRYWVAVLVWYRRFADYLDENGAGPPNADRGGCGMSIAVALHQALETARDAAERCARAASAVADMIADGPRCADAEVALRARLALAVDDGVICDPEVPE